MADNLSLELIKCLINQPGLDVNVRGLNGKTPLHCAIEFKHDRSATHKKEYQSFCGR